MTENPPPEATKPRPYRPKVEVTEDGWRRVQDGLRTLFPTMAGDVEVTGKHDDATKAALRKVQQRILGVKVTGTVDAATLAGLRRHGIRP